MSLMIEPIYVKHMQCPRNLRCRQKYEVVQCHNEMQRSYETEWYITVPFSCVNNVINLQVWGENVVTLISCEPS